MRSIQITCVGLMLTLTGCAAWHRPGLVYRGRDAETTENVPGGLVSTEFDSEEVPRVINLDTFTLTPPIEGVSHRTGYRGQPERARPVRKRRPPANPPGLGYIELPPPTDR